MVKYYESPKQIKKKERKEFIKAGNKKNKN